tara:strand:- start:321 stop:962 length:642 start_codon:yes stop_codon:yes gene_type:complete
MSLVVLEGNIGGGKSSVLIELKKMGFRVEQEAVVDPESMFSRALRTQSTFHLQVAASIDTYVRLDKISNMTALPDVQCFMERGRTGLDTFLQVAKEQKMVSTLEYDLCRALKTTKEKATPQYPKMIVYLDVDPALCLQRVRTRDRNGEEGITLEYLECIDRWYRTILFNTPHSCVVAKVTVQKESSAHDVATAVVAAVRSAETTNDKNQRGAI